MHTPGVPPPVKLASRSSREPLHIDEDGALGAERDRKVEREVAPDVPGRPAIDALGQNPEFDAQLLRLG